MEKWETEMEKWATEMGNGNILCNKVAKNI